VPAQPDENRVAVLGLAAAAAAMAAAAAASV
jgi:hypothetical protein